MQLLDLLTKLFELRQVAADQAKDGPSGSGAMNRALTAYEWLGDNIEAFVDSLDPEMAANSPDHNLRVEVGDAEETIEVVADCVSRATTAETRIAELEAENAKLREPDYFWDYNDPEYAYGNWTEALDEPPLGEVVHLLTGRSLPNAWVATRVLTVDEDGSPDETERAIFPTEAEANVCFEYSLAVARSALASKDKPVEAKS